MRVFVTGATGFIGFSVVRELINAGHEVTGRARSEKSAQALTTIGVRGHVGSIEDLECLPRGAAGANAAIHLALFHQITHMSLSTRLRVMLGGSPEGAFVSRFMKAAVDAEARAIEALGKALTGPDRAVVACLPTMALKPGRMTTAQGLLKDFRSPQS